MNSDSVHSSMSRAARQLQQSHDLVSTMQTAVDLAVQQVDGATAAALSIVHRRGRVDTPAATSESARHADELQYLVGEGPCLTAIWDDMQVAVPDIDREERWPEWAEAMRQQSGYRSMLIHRLFTTDDLVGALNLYAETPNAFGPEDADHAEALASHAAIAIRSAQEIAGLQVALDSRTTLGQATGMLMERYGLDAARAFSLLTRVSSQTNRKIRELADDITRTGTTDGLPDKREAGNRD